MYKCCETVVRSLSSSCDSMLNCKSNVGVSLAAVAAVAIWLALLIHFDYGGNWTALFCIGEHALPPAELAQNAYRWKGFDGYDGQYYRDVAHDPLFRKGYARFTDFPRMRYNRILLPAMAY